MNALYRRHKLKFVPLADEDLLTQNWIGIRSPVDHLQDSDQRDFARENHVIFYWHIIILDASSTTEEMTNEKVKGKVIHRLNLEFLFLLSTKEIRQCSLPSKKSSSDVI
jgi:hypothetical protein